MFINLQDYSNHSLQLRLTVTFTLQFKNIQEFNFSAVETGKTFP